MGFIRARGSSFFDEEKGDGVPMLLIHPAGATASTWGFVAQDLAGVGRVVAYDRRGYTGSGGEPVRSIPEHTAGRRSAAGDTGHAVAFDAPGNFVQVIGEAIRWPELQPEI